MASKGRETIHRKMGKATVWSTFARQSQQDFEKQALLSSPKPILFVVISADSSFPGPDPLRSFFRQLRGRSKLFLSPLGLDCLSSK